MRIIFTLFSFVHLCFAQNLFAQVDPNAGTAQAMRGAYERVVTPTLYDAVFPVIAFIIVICIPCLLSLWIIYQSLSQFFRRQHHNENAQ